MSKLPDELKHPSGGERLQGTATDAVRLAHRGLERFPDLVKRHKFIAGGAAVSSSLLVLAGVAIARRLRSGQTEEEAIASLTEEELTGRKDDREPWTNDADADEAALEDDEASADDAVAEGDVVEIEAEGEAAPSGNGHAPDDGVKQEVIPAKRGL
ncbi:MAG: hypothetical protein F4X76_08975 [Chloroflexi bacterium]|nr:hypothetical protein [Chloroflexota bacterium]